MTLKVFTLLELVLSGLGNHARAQNVPFSPCPLLGPRFPIPTQLSTSTIIQSGLQNLTKALDHYVTTLNGTFGPASATTSFSMVLFSTESTNASNPFLFEYHHSSASLANSTSDSTSGLSEVDTDTIYPIGDLTTLFTTWVFLTEAGEQHWSDSVTKWIPELLQDTLNTTMTAEWDKVTLGDLAAHLSGIGRFSVPLSGNSTVVALLSELTSANAPLPCTITSTQCTRENFLSFISAKSPVFAPGTTPILSNAGFILLAYALEAITNQTYQTLLQDSILTPLNLSRTFNIVPPSTNNSLVLATPEYSQWSAINAPFNGILSSPHDITIALRAILSSSLLPHDTTRRWLKPTSHTSNLVNSVGRPWEIYSLTATPISPVIPVYQVRGNEANFASHVGLVPDYGVGFVILATDEEGSPDLNAYADIIATEMVPVLERNAMLEAGKMFSGPYFARDANATIVVGKKRDGRPGLEVEKFVVGEKNVRGIYAESKGIEEQNLSFRLYPTNVGEEVVPGKKMVFRASFQDRAALADAGTPTCETWRYIDELQLNGVGLDEFVFEMGSEGAVAVSVPALDVRPTKQSEEQR